MLRTRGRLLATGALTTWSLGWILAGVEDRYGGDGREGCEHRPETGRNQLFSGYVPVGQRTARGRATDGHDGKSLWMNQLTVLVGVPTILSGR